MMEGFDPYHKWLGIRPEEQPADYYRLLGLAPLEDDPDVIENAADQRMRHLRGFQSGPRAALCQQLLNEVATARVCLLDPQQRAAYNAQWVASERPPFTPPATLADPPLATGEPPVLAPPAPSSGPRAPTRRARRPRVASLKRREIKLGYQIVVVAGFVAGIAVVWLILWLTLGRGNG